MRRIFFLVFCLALATANSPAKSADALSGQMRFWQQIAGTWQCSIHLHSDPSQGGRYEQLRINATPAKGNTLHLHYDVSSLHGDDYIGYSNRSRTWWDAGANTAGWAVLSTSKDNRTYTQASVASAVGKSAGVLRVIYALSRGVFTEHEELRVKHTWITASEVGCRRAR